MKAEAIRLYAEEGGKAANEATGVPLGTLHNWVHRESRRAGEAMERVAPGGAVPAVPVDGRPWSERREPLVRSLGAAVVEALEATRDAVRAGRLRDARDGSVAVGVLIDKAQLLSGSATSRSESFSVHADREDVKAEIERLERELGYRDE